MEILISGGFVINAVFFYKSNKGFPPSVSFSPSRIAVNRDFSPMSNMAPLAGEAFIVEMLTIPCHFGFVCHPEHLLRRCKPHAAPSPALQQFPKLKKTSLFIWCVFVAQRLASFESILAHVARLHA